MIWWPRPMRWSCWSNRALRSKRKSRGHSDDRSARCAGTRRVTRRAGWQRWDKQRVGIAVDGVFRKRKYVCPDLIDSHELKPDRRGFFGEIFHHETVDRHRGNYAAENRRHSKYTAHLVGKWQNGKLDGNACAVLAQCCNCKNVPRSVASLSSTHRLRKAAPVTLPKALRDNNTKGLSHGFRFRKAKHPLRRLIPKRNQAGRICIDDGVRRLARERPIELFNICTHSIARRLLPSTAAGVSTGEPTRPLSCITCSPRTCDTALTKGARHVEAMRHRSRCRASVVRRAAQRHVSGCRAATAR